MKTVLAIVGGLVLALAALGALSIGHFRLYYGERDVKCAAVDAARSEVKP